MRVCLAMGALAAWITVGAHPARAWTPFPSGAICRRPEVLDLVGRDLRARVAYASIDPRSVWERPSATANMVSCGVCLEVKVYDMPYFGPAPARVCQVHQFEVKRVLAGFVVSNVD